MQTDDDPVKLRPQGSTTYLPSLTSIPKAMQGLAIAQMENMKALMEENDDLKKRVDALEAENKQLVRAAQDSQLHGLMLKALVEETNGPGSYDMVGYHPGPRSTRI